jgi:predicted ATPase
MRCLVYADLNPGKLAAKVEKVRAAIERGDLRSADVKKLHHGPYCRAKLDDASRLLLQFVRCEGETVCLLLEVIAHHAYDKSRFLRGAAVDEDKLEPLSQAEAADCQPLRYVHPSRPEFLMLDKPLSLDDAQWAALEQQPPLVVVGSAGSGKTALLLQALRRAGGRVAYVTESRWLAEASQGLYVAFDGSPEDQEADFLSYQQLLETVHVPDGRPVTFSDFRGFFARHQSKLRFTNAHALFEELRGVLTAEPEGPYSREAYLALGVKQSLFDPEQREAIYEVFERYRPWLQENSLYEPNLIAHAQLAQVQPTYDLVALDEVQDLTNVQLALVLASLKAKGKFILAGDANQIVHPNYFAWSKVKSLFWRGAAEVGEQRVRLLTASYRNSPQVTDAANNLLRLKNLRFGSIDRESNQLMRAVGGASGTVASFLSSSRAIAELDQRTWQSTRVAVVVLRDEHKLEAQKRFKTPLIFSIYEAKGLEYESVILYRLVGSEADVYRQLAAGVDRSDLTGDELAYRRSKDKTDKSLEIYKFFVNALYVALTRAVRDVYLVEDDPAHPLLPLLGIAQALDAQQVQARRDTAEEWQREARRLQAQGKLDQAEAIRQKVLQVKAVPWPVFDRAHLPELMTKAVDKKNVNLKLRGQMVEFACLHDEEFTADRLYMAGQLKPRGEFSQVRKEPTKAAIQRSLGKGMAALLKDTEVYGVNHRTQYGLTPLMLAAYTGNLKLVEALLHRGADKLQRDHLGRMAMHWALRGFRDGTLTPKDQLGAIYDLTAPASFDVQVDGRLLQINREMGEYFLFQQIVARLSELCGPPYLAEPVVSAVWIDDAVFQALPEVVVSSKRKKRSYISGVFARAVVDGSYTPARSLWIRPRLGKYELNPELQLRAADAQGELSWQPLGQLLGLRWLLKGRAEVAHWRNPRRVEWLPSVWEKPWTPRQEAAAAIMAPGHTRRDLEEEREAAHDRVVYWQTLKERQSLEKIDELIAAIERGVVGEHRLSPKPIYRAPSH